MISSNVRVLNPCIGKAPHKLANNDCDLKNRHVVDETEHLAMAARELTIGVA